MNLIYGTQTNKSLLFHDVVITQVSDSKLFISNLWNTRRSTGGYINSLKYSGMRFK